MTKLKENLILILAIFLFILLTVPFIATLPYMDGNIDFVQTNDFYSGGINQYFSNWNTVHPPVKLLIALPFYFLFGISSVSYSFPGILIGIAGIVGIYLLTKDLFDQKTANLTTVFFSIYPLFIANSIFVMRDYLLTIFLLISLLFYIRKKSILYAISCSLAILTKEPALLLPSIVVVVEIIELIIKRGFNLKKTVLKITVLMAPFGVYFIWKLVLDANNKSSWNEWIFTKTENKGALSTIINNLLSFNFINPYAFEHWKQLFFLNFNWIYFFIILLGFAVYFLSRKKIFFYKNWRNLKVILIIFIFSISYLLTVLSLQTYTIPRYALPLIPFILIALAKSIVIFKNLYFQTMLILIVFGFLLTSLFFSLDPVATHLWGKTRIFDQKIYALNDQLAGNDGITYNIQYLLIAKNRSETILKASKEKKPVSSPYCRWIFPDPNNETKMIKTLKIAINFDCINSN